DASSLFPKDEQWAYFPAAAFAWRAKDESFLRESKVVNDLKFRVGYGITGQSDITNAAGYYPSSPYFSPGNANSQYLPGISTYTALPFNDKLKWEQTTTYNAGVDFSFFTKDLISGSVDVYRRFTRDLLATVPVPPGQALSNELIQNIGKMRNQGVEVNLIVKPIQTDDFYWEVGGNISYNYGTIQSLDRGDNVLAGVGLPVSTGLRPMRHKVGEQPSSFWLYEQLYDPQGNIIPGAFKDRNGDGALNDSDRYYRAMAPNWTFGLNTNFSYRRWDLAATFHGQLDGEVYNAIKLQGGWVNRALPNNTNSLSNVLNFYEGAADSRIVTIQDPVPLSDYYVENAAFLRCDNITVGYKIPEVAKNCSLRLFVGVNNAFLISTYSGQDPETFGGVDYNLYPRPRMYNFGLNLDF
ncbi:MAG: TonB-dependent receptor, partial [Sphingobacteriales bacterium]